LASKALLADRDSLTDAKYSETVERCSTKLLHPVDMAEAEILSERRSFIAGRWIESDEVLVVENPADESVAAELAATPLAEVRRAIGEARRSFDEGTWADLPARDRAKALHLLLDHFETLHQPLVASMVAEAGQPVLFAEMAQFAAGMMLARNTIDLYLALPHEESNPVPAEELLRGRVAISLRRHEPIGVVVAITPYNGAIIMAFQKLIAALMAGNSVILRPSPLTPLSSLAFGLAAEAAGLPHGVLSVIVESGAAGAELLTTDPAVDMVSFTGSTAVGRQILAQAAPTVKRVALELGGKSAQIYLPDALHRVAAGAAQVVAMTAGQACVAATRMLVPNDRKDEVLDSVGAAYDALSVGPPSDTGAMIGPLITAAQRARCERFVASAEENGGKVVVGGGRPTAFDRGYYFEPTVLDLPDNGNPAAQEEIFGPVLGVIGYQDLDDAVRIANDSIYGLSGQVYGADVAVATAVARRIRSGAVNVNTSMFSAYAPSGGYKQSGLGRERGVEGIRAFQEIKHLCVGELPA
jgi:aldehyde dehydrogenase (NAD+)